MLDDTPMIAKDVTIICVIGPKVSDEDMRQAVLDEDGHIRELPASEWRKFEWDSVVMFKHNYRSMSCPRRNCSMCWMI